MKDSGSGIGSIIVIVLVIIGFLAMMGSCSGGSSSKDTYRQNLESGYEKYQNGEKMTREEYNAVKNFNEWKDKQGEKSYDDWDN